MLHLCMYVHVVCVCVCVFTVNHVSRKSQTHDQKLEERAECERGYEGQRENIIITSQLLGHHTQWKEGVKRLERKTERWRRIGQRIGEIGVNYSK